MRDLNRYAGRLKPTPAFDNPRQSGEGRVFGTEDEEFAHFTDFSARMDGEQVREDVRKQAYLINPMPFILESNPVYAAKCALLDETGVVVWRDHDHIHGGCPMKEGKPYMDGIFYGIMQELGWEKYLHKYPNMPLIYHIPETTGRELARMSIEKLHLNGMRIVGDPDTEVKNVFICEHVNGRPMDYELMQITNSEDIDALIPLEVVDWYVSEYVRDGVQLGRPRVMLEMGHFNFEELGMRYMTRWRSVCLRARG